MKKSLLFISTIMCLSVPIFASAECQHVWSDWVVYDATCGDDGEKWGECSECYESEEVVLPATGNHIWGEWKVEEEADCIYDGRKYRECTVCGAWEDGEIPATGVHRWSEWEIENATCGEDGYKYRECFGCGKDE